LKQGIVRKGIVLFAHGSRDPEWARPFERIAASLASRKEFLVKIAYLELMRPSLDEAIADLVAGGVEAIRIVPVFLGMGGHVKEDLPRLVAAANPPVKVTIDPPIGEQASIIEAIAAAISRTSDRASP
jgi:sirohydrochlorin cobaltochelatase